MFKIVTVPHTAFAAAILVSQLQKLGYPAKIVGAIDVRDPDIYIIYNAVGLRRMPKRYIVMQTEIGTSHWFNSCYLRTIANAMAVWDYSELNVPRYSKFNRKIAIVTPGIQHVPTNGKDIDYLFYGWITGSERRKRILKEIQDKLEVMVIENTLMSDMWNILKRAKVVINIHYYDKSPLELYRIHESISHGCQVYLQDEGLYYENAYDNLEEVKRGLQIARV
jgi:hypothetical protein